MQWVAELEIFLGKKHFIKHSKGMINGARISRRPAGPMPGWIFHYLLSVVPGKEGRGMREGGQLNLFVATAETGLPVLGSCGYN